MNWLHIVADMQNLAEIRRVHPVKFIAALVCLLILPFLAFSVLFTLAYPAYLFVNDTPDEIHGNIQGATSPAYPIDLAVEEKKIMRFPFWWGKPSGIVDENDAADALRFDKDFFFIKIVFISKLPDARAGESVKETPVKDSVLPGFKGQVLNGFDDCGAQFHNGEFSLGWDAYEELDAKMNPPTSSYMYQCNASSSFNADDIVLADLDGDRVDEAIVPARVVRASSGGVLYVFKNVAGVARVVDQIGFGKENATIISLKNSVLIAEHDEFDFKLEKNVAIRETYRFVDGHFVRQ